MFFINDMGRDMLVIRDWLDSGKPPLLGPQTSALPINQTALYFYMMLPGYLLTNGSPLALFYTFCVMWVAVFIYGLWLLKGNTKMTVAWMIFFFLTIISPQYLTQSRFIVWNPSFVSPFLGIGLITFYLLNEKYSNKVLAIFAIFLALAVSFSYSSAPVLLSIYIFILFFWKKHRINALLFQVLAVLLVNLPTIAFEIKHKFILTSTLLSRGSMPQKASDISFMAKFESLFGFGLGVSGIWLVVAVVILLAIIAKYSLSKNYKYLKNFGFVLLISTIITFVIPITIHTHYIFGFTTLLFLCIGLLPRNYSTVIILLMLIVYGRSAMSADYFQPSRRTYEQMISCFKKVCNEYADPIFVSAQANFHPYHSAPEHRFMMKQAGCSVKYIEEQPEAAKLMAVVLDGGTYEHGKTAFNELTSFGKSKEIKRYSCQQNFGVVILGK